PWPRPWVGRRCLGFGLCPDRRQAVDEEQRRWREIPPERFLPGCADAGTGGFVFAAAGQVPGQADDVLWPGASFSKELDDALQRGADLGGHVRGIVALLVAAGLAGQHDPFA